MPDGNDGDAERKTQRDRGSNMSNIEDLVLKLEEESKYNMYNESMISLQSVQQNHTFVDFFFFFVEEVAAIVAVIRRLSWCIEEASAKSNAAVHVEGAS
ncbi:hypothetical protein JHK82_052485 [Glycine max]|nr:hypothetical protein JHK82_052485 [Glycine max]